MRNMNSIAGRLAAALSAVVLSFVLFGGTVTNPAQARSAGAGNGVAAYVGAMA